MACTPKIEDPQIDHNDVIFRGRCEGNCPADDSGKCQARFFITSDGTTNKNAKVTASGYGGDSAFIRVSADDGDIDDGLVILKCTCGTESREQQYHFTLKHRITAEDVLLTIFTLGVRVIVKAAGL